MSAEGWIFMVGLRVFDVGLLVIWLVWFFRLREDDDSSGEEGSGGGGSPPHSNDRPGGGGSGRPVPTARRRLRDHAGPHRRRVHRPAGAPAPARVRRPRSPVPARRW